MSSGGMEWAYRIVQRETLDPLAIAIVLHLGWRDHPNQRTDKGIARALGLHRTSVRRVTASLAEKGVIARRSGQWVSCETIAVVEHKADAPRPDAASADRGAHEVPPVEGGAHQVPPEGHIRCPQEGTSGAPKRKENLEKARKRAALPCERQAAPRRKVARTTSSAAPAESGQGAGDSKWAAATVALDGVPSRLVAKRRQFQGPDGRWYERPRDPEDAQRFNAWLLNAHGAPVSGVA